MQTNILLDEYWQCEFWLIVVEYYLKFWYLNVIVQLMEIII